MRNVPGRFFKKLKRFARLKWKTPQTKHTQAASKQSNNDDVAEQPRITGLLPRTAGVVPREAVRRHLRSQDELQGRQEVEP